MVRFFLSLLLILSTSISFARPPGTLIFGPEWTFLSDVTLRSFQGTTQPHEYFHYIKSLKSHFENICARVKGCKTDSDRPGSFLILSFEDGFELRLGTDPSVIEVSATPLSAEEWEQKSAFITEVLFDEMKKLNLTPHYDSGAGHVNIGIEYFKGDLLHLRNFIVDFYNHPGFGFVMNTDPQNIKNANYLHQMPKNEREKLYKGIAKLDMTTATFHDIVLAFQPVAEKYVALGLRDSGLLVYPKPESDYVIGPETRLEVRTLRPQPDMKSYQLVLEILQARIEYLKENRGMIQLDPPKLGDGQMKNLRDWARYIEEAGLPVDRYISLLPPHMQKIPISDYSSLAPERKGFIKRCKVKFF